MGSYTSAIIVLLSTASAFAEVTSIGGKGITFEEMAHTAKDKHRHGHLPPPLASTKYNTVHTDFDHDTSWEHDKGSTTRDGNEDEKAEEEKPASAFGTELFLKVCKNFPEGNILISPLSVYKALAMVKDGATMGSDNLAEMEKVLGSPSLIEQTEREGNDDPDVQLKIANSVWTNDLKDSFLEKVQADHNGEAKPMPSRYSTIDDWIEDNTDGMIKDFLGDEKIPSDIVALLVNALYFKGAWTYEFDPDKTFNGDFTLRDDSTLPAKFMDNTFVMGRIWESEALGGASAAILDYGKKADENDDTPHEFAAMFILPATGDVDSMNDVITALNSQSLSELLDNAWQREIHIQLPRFKLAFGAESLKDTLEDMGMKSAFDSMGTGNFDRMTYDSGVYLEDVIHGAVMEVTEDGTEAAAATVARMGRRSIRREPDELTFDRPFIVAIIHRPTGTPVFMGRVEEPDLDFD